MNSTTLLRDLLAPFKPIRLAVLYGSMARDQARRSSDVDLGVLLPQRDPEMLAAIEVTVGRGLDRAVDLIDLHEAPPLLRFEIARDGVLLLEREDDAWTRFKARAMVDWWDWAPTARFLHRAAIERLKGQVDGPA